MKLNAKRVQKILALRGCNAADIAHGTELQNRTIEKALQGGATGSYNCSMIAVFLKVRLDWLLGKECFMWMDDKTLETAYRHIMAEIDRRQTKLARIYKAYLLSRSKEALEQACAQNQELEALLNLEYGVRGKLDRRRSRTKSKEQKRAAEEKHGISHRTKKRN